MPNTPFHNDEMQDAIEELNQARTMMNNAVNKYRVDEAISRISAAESRIHAIRYERGIEDAKETN